MVVGAAVVVVVLLRTGLASDCLSALVFRGWLLLAGAWLVGGGRSPAGMAVVVVWGVVVQVQALFESGRPPAASWLPLV